MSFGWALFGLAIAGTCAAAWLTGLFRTYALRTRLIDGVNARGSHSVATPRGGGASIVIVSLVGFAVATVGFGLPVPYLVGLLGGGVLIGSIGWLDDHGHVPPLVRLAAHFAGAIWAVAWIGALPLDVLGFWPADWELAARAVSVIIIVWMVNLYNFMDGIDGLAGGEAAAVAFGGAILLWLGGAGPELLVAPVILGAAALGFLYWNWPPAKIFMGDASSGFLGFALAALGVVAGQAKPAVGIAWFVLLGVFVVDATITLLRRLIRGRRVHEAHRSHAYQRIARRAGRHLPVTLGALAITLLWLFPLGCLIALHRIAPIPGILLAAGPLLVAAIGLGAGVEEE
jgi:Fuc2NAc and GlcNAc transferase